MRKKETLSNCSSEWMNSTTHFGGNMMKFMKSKMSPAERAQLENAIAANRKQAATIDYNIMMGNLEDPEEMKEEEEDE